MQTICGHQWRIPIGNSLRTGIPNQRRKNSIGKENYQFSRKQHVLLWSNKFGCCCCVSFLVLLLGLMFSVFFWVLAKSWREKTIGSLPGIAGCFLVDSLQTWLLSTCWHSWLLALTVQVLSFLSSFFVLQAVSTWQKKILK